MAGKEVFSMEGQHERSDFVSNEAGQASIGSDQPVIATEAAEKLSIVVQVGAMSGSTTIREERFKSVMDAEDDDPSESQTPYKRIQKVPCMLREKKDLKKYFEPRVVSIGPYHHGNVKLKPAETIKLKFTKRFVDESHQPIEVLYDKIFKEIKKLRDCYDEEPTEKYDDEALAWMMFVDGCTVLHYILYYTCGKSYDLKIKDYQAAFVNQDLFLLENQLPFLVLKKLMKLRFRSHEGMEMIEQFIRMNLNIKPPQIPVQSQAVKENPSHLLGLLRKRLIGNRWPQSKNKDDDQDEDWNSFRNVTELMAAGICLKPSQTKCLTDISFSPHFISGQLNLPPITIDDSTKPKFLNLIAYEMCPDVDIDSEVTSYICFLDSLIDHPDDVKELRKERILHNFLGSDEEVAKLFNEMTNDLVPSSHIYRDVKLGIQKHYDTRWKTHMAIFKHEHFKYPWSVIALVAAIFAFLITGIATYFTIFPRT